MTPLGLLVFALAAPPPVPGPVLSAGDELLYAGEVREESTRFNHEYRRRTELTVRVLVLDSKPGRADLAVLTRLRPLEDPTVKESAAVVAGGGPDRPAAAAVRLALVRVNARGQVQTLKAPARVPLALTAAETGPPPMDVELGLFAPLPAEAAETWAGNGLTWSAGPLAVRDGAQVIELCGVVESADWANRTGLSNATRRADRVWLSPADGLARVFDRTCETTAGLHVVERRTTHAALKQTNTLRGDEYEAARREVGFAHLFAAELAAGSVGKLRGQIDRFRQQHEPTAYREAVDAVARRLEP